MRSIHFPERFAHNHPPIKNINDVFEGQLTLGQRAADMVAKVAGSWAFVLTQTGFLSVWVVLNVAAYVQHWDPYPFILMNLMLSLQAAYAAPILMMSQNRQAARDRIEAHNDFEIDQKAEEEIRLILEHLESQNEAIVAIHETLQEISSRLDRPAASH